MYRIVWEILCIAILVLRRHVFIVSSVANVVYLLNSNLFLLWQRDVRLCCTHVPTYYVAIAQEMTIPPNL